MITRVRVVAVDSQDQDRAVAFYEGLLGFEKRRDEPMGPDSRWIELAPPGGGPVIVPFEAGTVFECDDLQATYDELTARGVDFTQEPKHEDWGSYAQFRDPDGNEFVLVPEGT